MARLRNHYDNLQVTRTASAEVIRASYRVLAQKYHPDKHGAIHSSAEHWMKIINQAYAVLSDPEMRVTRVLVTFKKISTELTWRSYAWCASEPDYIIDSHDRTPRNRSEISF